MITIKDIEKAVKYPHSARDKNGRLLCAAAIGATSDVLDRAAALVEAQVDALVLDSAHGHSRNILNAVSRVKAAYPGLSLIAGNIATAEAAEAMIAAGADAIKGGHRPRLHLYHPRGGGHRRAADHGGLRRGLRGGPLRHPGDCGRRRQVFRRFGQGHRRRGM